MNFEIKNLHFLPHAACDVTIELAKGEGVVFTGPNGIGKSTFFQAVMSKYESKMQLSLINQITLDFFYDRKIIDVQKILLESRPDLIDEQVLKHLWDEFGLSEKNSRTLSALSGGERQALKICMGLSKKADVYLLDEPFQSLDASKRDFLSAFISKKMKENFSFMIIEHELKNIPSGFNVLPFEMHDYTLKTGKMWTI